MTMNRLLLICLFSCLAIGSAFAQTKKADSLRAVLAKHPQADTFRVNRLNELIQEGFKKKPLAHPEQLDSLASHTLQLAQRLNYPYGQAFALWNQGGIKYWQGQIKQTQQLSQRALVQAKRSGNKPFLLTLLLDISYGARDEQQRNYFRQAMAVAQTIGDADVIFNTHMRIVYICADNYIVALQWGLPLLAKVEKGTNLIHYYLVLEQLSYIYLGLKDYDQALIYLKRMQLVGKRLGNKEYQGVALATMGDMYQKKGQPDQAIAVLKQARTFLVDQWQLVVPIEGQLAQCFEQKGDHQAAMRYAHRALATLPISEEDDTFYKVPAWLALSQAHFYTNRLDSALYYGVKCLQRERVFLNNGRLETPRDVNKILAQIYVSKKDYGSAYRYQIRFMTYKDSLNNEEVTRKATAARFNDQMSRQQSQIVLLTKDKQLQAEEARRQRKLLYISLVVLILIGCLLALLYRNNRQKQRANILLEKQKVEIQHQRDQTQQALAELKATQAQLVQKEKMASLGELTAGIAHEIQNPLNFVNNFSEVSAEMVEELAEEHQKPQRDADLENELLTDLKDNLHKITHHGQRASNIVKGMLEHARNSSGEVQPTNLNALADEYLRLAYHGQRAKDKDFSCELITQFDPAIGQVAIMSQEIGRVLLNLFSNAFYAVRERQKQGDSDYQPTVTVSTVKTKAGVEIRVSDNGMGMAESVEQKIFQPFFTTKPTGQGTGLGLSLSYDIITKGHDGNLKVESQEGEGSRFTIQLPTSPKQAKV